MSLRSELSEKAHKNLASICEALTDARVRILNELNWGAFILN